MTQNFIQKQDGHGNYYFTGEKTGVVFRLGDKVKPGLNFHWGDHKKDGLVIYKFYVTDRHGFDPKPEDNGKSLQFVYAGVEKGNWERQAHLNNLDLIEQVKIEKYDFGLIL